MNSRTSASDNTFGESDNSQSIALSAPRSSGCREGYGRSMGRTEHVLSIKVGTKSTDDPTLFGENNKVSVRQALAS